MMTFGKLPALLLNDVAILNLAILCLYFEVYRSKKNFWPISKFARHEFFPSCSDDESFVCYHSILSGREGHSSSILHGYPVVKAVYGHVVIRRKTCTRKSLCMEPFFSTDLVRKDVKEHT